MKTKLLRKVRKNWEIVKVTSIGTNPTSDDMIQAESLGLPFYEVKGENSAPRSFYHMGRFKTIQECKDFILKWVIDDYKRWVKPKQRSRVEKKVWYNEPQKPSFLEGVDWNVIWLCLMILVTWCIFNYWL